MNTFLTLILAIIAVESGGDDRAIGDNGRAFGCLQIWNVYVVDSNEHAGTSYRHEDAFDRDSAIRIFTAYMRRYATEDRLGRVVTAEDIARIHNGGPNGYKKAATEGYWQKVKAELHRMGEHDLAEGKVGFAL